GLTLPKLALAANTGKLLVAHPLRHGPKCRPCFDRLQLFRVPHEHHLGSSIRSVRYDSLHLPTADHARLVDDEHVPPGKAVMAFAPRLLPRSQGAALDL